MSNLAIPGILQSLSTNCNFKEKTLEELQEFIKDNKKYIEDDDPVFFNCAKYIRNSTKAQLAELAEMSDEKK